MKRLLYVIPLLAVPFLAALHKAEKPDKPEKPMPHVAGSGRHNANEIPKPSTAASVQRARSDRRRPPIDEDVPKKVETATFALG